MRTGWTFGGLAVRTLISREGAPASCPGRISLKSGAGTAPPSGAGELGALRLRGPIAPRQQSKALMQVLKTITPPPNFGVRPP